MLEYVFPVIYVISSIAFFYLFFKMFKGVRGSIRDAFKVMSTLKKNIEQLPWVYGEVLDAFVEEAESEFVDSHSSSVHKPVIVFTYQVAEKEYTANNKRVRMGQVDEQSAQAMLEKHPVGSRIRVHYNPQDPQEAYMEIDLKKMKESSRLFRNLLDDESDGLR